MLLACCYNLLMGIFSKSKEDAQLVAVFDIGSASVGGALFYLQDSGVPKLVFSVREKINFDLDIEPTKFLNSTLASLDIVAHKIATAKLGAPEKIFVVLTSPWYTSQNRIIKLEKNTNFIFNAKLADSLIEREVKLFEDEHLLPYIQNENAVRAIELKSVRTMLNGYEVSDPCNQKAKSLEMTLFISLSGEEVLSSIENIMGKHFHTNDVKFSSFLITFFTVVRDMFLHQEDFLLIDVGGEMTDISMVKKNSLKESTSYPLGTNSIVRGMAKSMNSSLSEAESTFSLYKDGHMEENLKSKVVPVINSIKNDWLHKFQSSLANLSTDISIPATIFIAIDKNYSDFFAEIIKTEQFNQYTLTESKFQIIFLNSERLHGAASFDDNVLRDNFLIIESIYINRFLKQDNAQK